MMVEPDTHGEDGFTLIELLIALALLSMLTVMIASALSSSRRALESVEARSAEASIEAIQSYLRHTIADMRAIRRPGQPLDAPLIEATSTRLKFITGYTPRGQYAGLAEIELSLRETATPRVFDLVERRSLYRPAPQPGQPEPVRLVTETRLVSGTTAAAFKYFGTQEEGAEPAWHRNWDAKDRLPAGLELGLVFAPGENRTWKALVASLPKSK